MKNLVDFNISIFNGQRFSWCLVPPVPESKSLVLVPFVLVLRTKALHLKPEAAGNCLRILFPALSCIY